MPPYTTSSAGFSATSGSRLFWITRNGASVGQLRHVSVVPRGERISGPMRRWVITVLCRLHVLAPGSNRMKLAARIASAIVLAALAAPADAAWKQLRRDASAML